MALVSATPRPSLAWQFDSSNVDYLTGLSPNLSTTGTYAAPSGGTITTVGNQRIHTFTTVGTTSITFLVPVTAQVLVVAGGGGGGGNNGAASAGGGGGAGEMYSSASYAIAAGTYTVTVGAAGVAGVASTSDGGDGGSSVFGSISANGGGGGSTGGTGNAGRPGGSGGGTARGVVASGGASVLTAGGLGNAGGDNANLANYSAGGGGGAGTAGTNASASGATPVPGGTGSASSISGASVTYATGGNGGARSGTYTPGAGTNGRGDGGDGAPAGTGTAVNGARGGSGVVIISYNAALYPAPTYVTGVYKQAISFNNTLSPAGADPNCYVSYDVSSFGIVANSATMSLWLNSGLSYPIATGNPFYINLQGASYNGIYTPSTDQSNIAMRTGSSPAVTVGTRTAQTGIWTHHCAVFSNVGASSTNTITSYYVNGSLIGTANNARQTFTTLNLGCQSSGSNGALCSIDDVRLFKTALSVSQVQAIYQARGMPGRGDYSNIVGTSKVYAFGNPLFSQLSTTATSSAVGAFSVRTVNGVTAKAVQIKRQSDNATADFYSDRLGNLLTTPVTGTPLNTWLTGSTGNVVTWYSHTGSSTATQPTVANQLQLTATGLPQFSSTGSSTFYPISGLNLGSVDGSYSKAFWVNATSNASQFNNFLSTSTASTGQGIHSFGWAFTTGSNVPYVYCGQNNYTAYLTSCTFALNTWTHLAMSYSNPSQTLKVYMNGTQVYSNTSWTSSFNAGDGNLATGFRIGRGFGNPCDAQAYDILVFNSALSQQDITTLYNSRLY